MTTTLKNFGFASTLSFGLILGVAVAGCAADSPANPPGGDTTGSGDNSGGDDAPHPMDATGKYRVQSTFDISTNMPGTVGVVVNDFIAATDDPDDPTHWILDQIIAQMPNGTLKSLLSGAEPFVAGYLNDQLLDIAPDFVTTIIQVGNDFGDMAKHFGLNETLEIAASATDGQYSGTRTAYGAHFKIDTQTFDLKFSDYNVANVVVPNIGIQLDSTAKLTIAQHALMLPYGGIIHIGLDAAVIPMVDSNAHNLNELLADKIDCTTVGQDINDALVSNFGFGPGASALSAACTAGLNAAANAIYAKLNSVSATALEFDVDGTTKAADTNHDYKVDALQTGKWEGMMKYSGTPAPLAPATFTGTRM